MQDFLANFQGLTLQQWLAIGLGSLGLIWYYVCLIHVGFWPPDGAKDPGFREFEKLTITTISVALATFVGMLLGLKQSAEHLTTGAGALSADVRRVLDVSDFQVVCAVLYVFSLIIAIVCWAKRRDRTDGTIVNLAKSLLGLIVGALSISLSNARP